MKSFIEDLPPKKREALARLYEREDYKILVEVMEQCRLNAATQALDAGSWEEVKHLQGQAHGIKMLHLNLKDNHKKLAKD